MKTNKLHISKQVTAKDIITYPYIFDANLRDHAEYCIKSGMGRLILQNHGKFYSSWIDPKDNKYWYLVQRQTRKKRIKKKIWFEWNNS